MARVRKPAKTQAEIYAARKARGKAAGLTTQESRGHRRGVEHIIRKLGGARALKAAGKELPPPRARSQKEVAAAAKAARERTGWQARAKPAPPTKADIRYARRVGPELARRSGAYDDEEAANAAVSDLGRMGAVRFRAEVKLVRGLQRQYAKRAANPVGRGGKLYAVHVGREFLEYLVTNGGFTDWRWYFYQ